jgi:hypothetical protein
VVESISGPSKPSTSFMPGWPPARLPGSTRRHDLLFVQLNHVGLHYTRTPAGVVRIPG